jgi:beta-N-acetylhexosaminidase
VRRRSVVLGYSGEALNAFERDFFPAAEPRGFILPAQLQSPDQFRELVAALRECVGRNDAPVLIDQEGGRVAWLRPPHWPLYPSAARFASLPDPLAERAAHLAARLIAADQAGLGITVDCMPVLDLPGCGADPVTGLMEANLARLARAVCEGLLHGGAVLPVIKHIPGHGRTRVDSHHPCPQGEAKYQEPSRTHFAPFRALATMPWAMTAHIVFAAIDPRLRSKAAW